MRPLEYDDLVTMNRGTVANLHIGVCNSNTEKMKSDQRFFAIASASTSAADG